MDNVISLSGINKIYGSEIKTQVLYDINLDIRAQSFSSIIGASGSGKSTLLNIISTLDRPTSGSVVINGIQTTKMTKADLAKLRNETIGFVFQFHYLLPEFSALDNVAMPLLMRREPLAAARQVAAQALERMGLAARVEHRPGELSGGERQRVAIARALVSDPSCVLADEPTGNLDRDTATAVFAQMLALARDRGTAFVLVTHDPELASRCDRTLRIDKGRIAGL